MHSDQTTFGVILIDDDPAEKLIIERILKALTDVSFRLDHVTKCSQAIKLIEKNPYKLVLLDNLLSHRMSAKFSVPIIKSASGGAPMAVISNDVSPDYLQSAKDLGVDYIVDKANMIDFIKSQMNYLLGPANLS
jgi:DNA-binding NtrC family response regulator